MLTVGPAGPYRAPKSRRAPGHLPPLPPPPLGGPACGVSNTVNCTVTVLFKLNLGQYARVRTNSLKYTEQIDEEHLHSNLNNKNNYCRDYKQLNIIIMLSIPQITHTIELM